MRTLFLTFLFFFLSVLPVSAQTEWTITTFQSDITIQTDGTVQVEERINVDFKNHDKHGIYRDIPLVYQNENNELTYTRIKILSILQDGSEAEYRLTDNENYQRIRIGDPDRTISGTHSYQIIYSVIGVLRSFDTYDELYWNVTGNDWEAEIEHASATVTVPADQITQSTCFEGYEGSTNLCASKQTNTRTATYTATAPLQPTQGLTIVTGFTKGMVPILTVEPPKKISDDLFTPLALGAFLFALAGGLGSITWIWMKNGRDFWYRTRLLLDPNAKEEVKPIGAHEPIVVEFEPPENLRPAELGVLMDEQADTLDITATIIDLAHRGFLTIKEIEKKWIFGSTDYALHRTNKQTDILLPYEKLLLDRLFTTKTVKMSALKTTFYDDLAEVKKRLYEDVMNKKLFAAHPEKTRTKYLGFGFAILFLGAICIFGAFPLVSGLLLAFGAGTVLSGIIWIITSRSMPRRSALGREYYQRVLGYRLFISGAEKYRQQFFEKKNLFNEILPYAIVFGLTEKFAKAMKDMGIKPQQPAWYTGHHAFAPAIFASEVNNFSQSLSTAIASTPSKSGGFSGGSSGGGFGGGGGGSW